MADEKYRKKDKRGTEVQSLFEKIWMAEKFPGSQAKDGPVPRKAGTTLWGAGTNPGTHRVPIRRMRENKPWRLLDGACRENKGAEGVTTHSESRVLQEPGSGETPFYGRLACQHMA